MSKKDKKTVINNIKELNLEIDYDRLADAIVKAEKKKEEKEENDPAAKTFLIVSSGLLKFFAIACIIGSVVLICASLSAFCSTEWGGIAQNIGIVVGYLIVFAFAVLIIVFSHKMWWLSKEVEKIKDRNYATSIFSALVSFAALIVAFVALLKEVG